MSPELERAVEALREHAIFDQGLLKSGGRREIQASIDRWAARDRRARLLLLARDTSLVPWRAMWDLLSLDPDRDLLLLFNGRRWEARGWGLTQAQIRGALDSARAGLQIYYGRGLVQAIDALGQSSVGGLAGGQPDPTQSEIQESGWLGVSPVAVGAVAVGLAAIAFVVARRRRVTQRERAEFDQAHAQAERTYADVVIAADRLDDSVELQSKAGRLKESLDTLKRDADRKPGLKADPVTVGRVRQIESELAAIRSTVLQKSRRS